MHGLYPNAVGIDVIRRHTAGLAAIAATAAPSTPVSTCGDWTLADLTWHLTEVQAFWCHVLATRPDGGPATYDVPVRPSDPAALAPGLAAVGDRLIAALVGVDPEEPAWSWSDDHTVGFTVRRQSHEALVHHVDAVLAVGAAMPDVAFEVAADGVDELVRVMLTAVPDGATFSPGAEVLQVTTADTRDTWALQLGRLSVSGADGSVVERPGAALVDAAPTTSITAGALDLLLWLWGRQDSTRLSVSGDPAGVEGLRSVVLGASQ